MEEMKQETMETTQKAQEELTVKERKVAAQVAYAIRDLYEPEYAPGEQEAVAQAAHDAGLAETAIRRAKRRHLRQSIMASVIMTLWAAYCIWWVVPLTDAVLSRALGGRLELSQMFSFIGRVLGIVVGVLIYYYNGSARCQETGGHIQIGRLKLAKSLISALAVLLVAEALMLGALSQKTPMLLMRNVIWAANLTGFMLTLLGYLVTTFSIMAFFRTRPQMLAEEKLKLGIFD